MDWIISLIAYIAAIAGLVSSLGHGGYLYMLGSTARKRAGGEPIAQFARGRYGAAAAGTLAGLVALLLAGGGFAGVLAIVLGAGATAYSVKSLQTSRERLRLGGSTKM